jgi:hypothetical protein
VPTGVDMVADAGAAKPALHANPAIAEANLNGLY